MDPNTLTPAQIDYLLAGSPLRRRPYGAVAAAALLVALAFATFITLRLFARLDAAVLQVFLTGIAVAVIASMFPVTILWFLDRRERESRWLFAVAFLWGALIATGLALPLNNAILRAVETWLGLNPGVAEYLGPEAALMIGAPIAGPLVEETTKGLGVLALFLLLRAEFDNARDGLVYGALVGAGFNCLEAPLYVAQGFAEYGFAPWGLQFGGRFALFGLAGHALYTGVFGALLGVARQTRRRWLALLAPLGGLLLAIGAHAFNNALGLLVTIGLRAAGEPPPEPGPPPDLTFVEAWLMRSLLDMILFFPMLLIAAVLVWRSGVWERRVIREQLADEVSRAVTPEEYAQIQRDGILRTRRVDRTRRRTSAAIVNAQNELAFRKWRVRTEGGDPEQDPLVRGWRARIAALREG
ncbi:MAG TPA: PrsW family glutamic-type intramembrane protease [Roseiflexaceae bacterium]|nr:PrsW family glutamic-type intramembrane protease [Roseiflexaceae bacterium]